MKNITIRRMTERGEALLRAAAKATFREPHFRRYVQYLRYRRNLKRLGIS